MILDIQDINTISNLLKSGKIGVLPTDTIYGLHCLADDESMVKEINTLKGRPEDTPLITLISDVSDLEKFDLVLNGYAYEQIDLFWPGPNTLIFETIDGSTKSFRLPDNEFLVEVLKITGPLVSTSANKHGEDFALEIIHAQESFNESVGFYVNSGKLENTASSMYRVLEDSLEKIR